MTIRPVNLSARVRRTRAAVLAVAVIAACALTFGTTAPAEADTVPVLPTEPASVSSDALPTVQIDGVVWSQAVVGDIVYAGGNFQSARPAGAAPGTSTVKRTHLLAYNITTGVLVSSFAPTLNDQIRAVAASPDGTRVYIGGNFTQVNGVTRNRIAAFDTATGALTAFNPNPNYVVNSITASNDTVWFGGGFTSVGGSARTRAAAVSSAGALQPWAPAMPDGKVTGIALSPDNTKIVLGGSFTSLNSGTNPGYGLGMVASTGAGTSNLPFKANAAIRNAGVNGSITSLYAAADGVYGTGYDYGTGANFEGSFHANWSDGSLVWLDDCHGDSYSVFASGGLAYKAGHPHHCKNIGGFPETNPRVEHRATAYTSARVGTVSRNTVGGSYTNFEGQPAPSQVNWFPDINTGTFTGATQGPWNVSGDSRYVVYGGEFTRVNNKGQQGLVRFAVKSLAPNSDGPRVSGAEFVPTVTTGGRGETMVTWVSNWDRDNELLSYTVWRNGAAVKTLTATSRFWVTPTLSFTDTGLTPGASYDYVITASDPLGNKVTGGKVTGVAGTTAVEPPPVVALATDTFGRSLASGWGSAEKGGAWSVSGGAANYSVASGVGAVSAPSAGANLNARLGGVTSASTDVTVDATLKQPVTGASAYVAVFGRWVGSQDYRARVIFGTTGSVQLQIQQTGANIASATLTGATYVAGDTVKIRLLVTGTNPTTIKAKIWRATDAQPAAWTLTTTDATAALQSPGNVGLGYFVGGATTGLPSTVAFDNFSVVAGE